MAHLDVRRVVSNNWQKILPWLSVACAAIWIACCRFEPTGDRAVFIALLCIYVAHQIEEHLWPGGFRQFANEFVFKSGEENWPVDRAGVALVNTGFVWVPLLAAALFPVSLAWVGLGWIGLTLINGISHIATTVRLRRYNPGLVTSIVLFLPFTLWVLVNRHIAGTLSGIDVAAMLVAGIVLHVPVAAVFVVPFWRNASRKIAPEVFAD
jgi:Protein of unknown function with HXXEE motif